MGDDIEIHFRGGVPKAFGHILDRWRLDNRHSHRWPQEISTDQPQFVGTGGATIIA